MRVLVTGHEGFIGAVLAPMLQARGHRVVGMDTGYFVGCDFGAAPKAASKPTDIRDAKPGDLEGFDAVLHLAALSNDPLGDLDAELTFDINHRATVHLANLARAAGVPRFVFSSSCSNYGASDDHHLLTEEAPFNPVTAYGVSKVRAEKDLLEMASGEFCPVILRSATAYGLSPRLRCDIVLNNLTAFAVATGKVLIRSDGTPWRPIVHVEDICRAFIAALEAPRERVYRQAFNVGRTEENYRVRELAEIVRNTVPGCQIEFAGGASPDPRNYRVDCSKIARELPDFKPAWTAREGARQLYEAFRDAGIKVEDFEGHRYRRVGQIKRLQAESRLKPDLRWRE